MICVIYAASVRVARGRTSHNPPVVGSSPTRPTCDFTRILSRNVPDLRPDPSDPRPEWQQAADKLRAAIETGELAPGDALPSVPDLAQLQGLKPGTVRHMFVALAEAGLVQIRHGRTTTVTGGPRATPEPADGRGLSGRSSATTANCPGASRTSASPSIKGIRHYTASQLLAAGFDLGNTAARLGHSGGALPR
jgi:DNA-binding transcriptional regulator YhcF (GntR family)